jgi:hypothetical protein
MLRGRTALPFTSRRARSLRLLRPQRQTLSWLCPSFSASPGRVRSTIHSVHLQRTHWHVVTRRHVLRQRERAASRRCSACVCSDRDACWVCQPVVVCAGFRNLTSVEATLSFTVRATLQSVRSPHDPPLLQGNAGLVNVFLPSLESVGTLQISVRACTTTCMRAPSSRLISPCSYRAIERWLVWSCPLCALQAAS